MDSPPPPTQRHKCSACYKQYKKKEHLIEHMKISCHSAHDPKCPLCKKHCKSLESVREHLTGLLPKDNCADIFATNGCKLCLNIFDSPDDLSEHMDLCLMASAIAPGPMSMPIMDNCFLPESLLSSGLSNHNNEVVAIDCEMVGGGSDGSLDLCARVCIINEDENVIFHSFVQPIIPVNDYRYELTGISQEHLASASPLLDVSNKIEEILYNGEPSWKARLDGGKARILVGHDLEHDLNCLRISYPDHLIRDTAKYRPLMRTNLVSHSLKYLTKTYLGYEIQTGIHNPYEDCVAAMRLYKRMRAQLHGSPPLPVPNDCSSIFCKRSHNPFDLRMLMELKKMSSDELLAMSISSYKCWCLDNLHCTDF
ncbi:RNA exonuclease 4-like [Zingiber officinale]|uniref:RNA exonuclease 4-like n=1 Tax=Zingiber officinale TaxID=94328 RepID=UPI001C4AA56F|nr:RNA exonuclease 4-like [Zingiber officinale]